MDVISPLNKFGLNLTSSEEEMPKKQNLKGGMAIPIDLNSRFGMAYSGPIYIDRRQQANVIYDTGSAWLTVTSNECE